MGLEDTMVWIQGYENRANDQWQQTRILAYTIACTVTEKDERGDIYELFPLPGDPTPEEIQEQKEKEYQALREESLALTKLVREQMNMFK